MKRMHIFWFVLAGCAVYVAGQVVKRTDRETDRSFYCEMMELQESEASKRDGDSKTETRREFREYDRIVRDACKLGFEKLPYPDQVFLDIWDLQGEVNNGGFHQYCWNSSGARIKPTIAALHEIGAKDTAKLCEQMLELLGVDELPEDDLERRLLLDLVEKRFEGGPDLLERSGALDSQFYKSKENLTALTFKYMDKHRK